MTEEDRAALETERADLARKVAKRRDQGGFAQNVIDIDARIAAIDAELAEGEE